MLQIFYILPIDFYPNIFIFERKRSTELTKYSEHYLKQNSIAYHMHGVHFSKKRSQNHTINGTVKVKLKAFQNNPKWKKEYNVVHLDKQRRTLYLTPKPKAELTKQAVVSLLKEEL